MSLYQVVVTNATGRYWTVPKLLTDEEFIKEEEFFKEMAAHGGYLRIETTEGPVIFGGLLVQSSSFRFIKIAEDQ